MFDPKAAVAIVGVMVGGSVCWSLVYAWGKWLVRPRPALPSADLDQRLLQIERSLEAVMLEMERVGEGQRFTTRLLSERAAVDAAVARPPAAPGRVLTPH